MALLKDFAKFLTFQWILEYLGPCQSKGLETKIPLEEFCLCRNLGLLCRLIVALQAQAFLVFGETATTEWVKLPEPPFHHC